MRKMRTLTEEHKRKISEALKGYIPSEEARANMSKAGKGRVLSAEHRMKIRIATKGKRHKSPPPSFRQKRRDIMMGNKLTLGYIPSNETRQKLSEANRREKHWNWKGGVLPVRYPSDFNIILKRQIRERDGHICQLCTARENGRLHSIHHIDYNKDNCHPLNLLTLCVSCNSKVNFNIEHWTTHFQGLVEVKYGLTG